MSVHANTEIFKPVHLQKAVDRKCNEAGDTPGPVFGDNRKPCCQDSGNQPRQLCSIGFLSDPDLAERKDYTEDLFDIPPKELGQYTLHGDFYTASSRTDGLWRVTFPLETT